MKGKHNYMHGLDNCMISRMHKTWFKFKFWSKQV